MPYLTLILYLVQHPFISCLTLSYYNKPFLYLPYPILSSPTLNVLKFRPCLFWHSWKSVSVFLKVRFGHIRSVSVNRDIDSLAGLHTKSLSHSRRISTIHISKKFYSLRSPLHHFSPHIPKSVASCSTKRFVSRVHSQNKKYTPKSVASI